VRITGCALAVWRLTLFHTVNYASGHSGTNGGAGPTVQIRKQQERSFWGAVLINSIPDVAIAWLASAYFNTGLGGFLAVYFGLQALYLALWTKRVIWGWLVFWLSGRRKMTAHLENYLLQQRFPQPPEFIGGVDDYLSGIADDSKVHPQVRVKAATELGVLAGIRASGNLLYATQITMAFESALQNYSRRFLPREPRDEQMDYINDQDARTKVGPWG
jgi:hypothetical protein